MKTEMFRRTAAIGIATALVLAACGDDDGDGTATTDAPTTEVPGTLPPVVTVEGQLLTIDDIEIDPDAEPAGNLFGGAAAAESDEALVDPGTAEICAPGYEAECDDIVEAPPTTEFVPLPEHQPFCTLLADMSDRPYPDDEYEQLVVAQAWFRELRPLAPAEIEQPFDLVIAFVDDLLRAQNFDVEPDPDDPVIPALDSMGEFVDDACDL